MLRGCAVVLQEARRYVHYCERFARMKGSGEQDGIAFKGRCGRCKVQAKRVRGLTVGRRGATAVQRGRKAELEGGAGGRRAPFACMKTRGGQVSDIAFGVKMRRGCAVVLLEARRYVHYSAQVEGGLKAGAFPPRRVRICLFRSAVSDQYCKWYWST